MLKKKLKILHIISSLGNGGAEKTLFKICKYDNQNFHSVISLMDNGKYGHFLKSMNIKIHTLEMKQGEMSIKAIFKILKILICNRPDVVQTWMYHSDLLGGVLAKLLGIKKIYWNIRNANLDKSLVKKKTYFLIKFLSKLSYIIPYKIISCSKKGIDTHSVLGYQKNFFSYIPNGYKNEKNKLCKNKKNFLKKKYKIHNTHPIIGLIARFHPQKDHENLLNALSLVKSQNINFFCILMGPGISFKNKKLRSLILKKNLKKNVRLFDDNFDVIEIMNIFDINILSSKTEGFPNVIAEAMQYGIPSISTDVGDASIIIKKNGWVARSRNSIDLAKKIKLSLSCIHSPEWIQKSFQSKMDIKRNYSLELMVKRYNNLWRS